MMKRTGRMVLATAVVALALVMSGCNLNKTSIEDRIDMFISDVQAGSYGSMYEHFHEDSTTYTVARTDGVTFWDTTSFSAADGTKTFSGLSYGDPTIGTYLASGIGTDTGITFDMREEDKDDWFIRSITFASGSYAPNLN